MEQDISNVNRTTSSDCLLFARTLANTITNKITRFMRKDMHPIGFVSEKVFRMMTELEP